MKHRLNQLLILLSAVPFIFAYQNCAGNGSRSNGNSNPLDLANTPPVTDGIGKSIRYAGAIAVSSALGLTCTGNPCNIAKLLLGIDNIDGAGGSGFVVGNYFGTFSSRYFDSGDKQFLWGPTGSGQSVAVLGDINGDQIPELVGANSYYSVQSAFVIDFANSSILYELHSPDPSDASTAFGTKVVSMGDLDDDGKGDFAVSALNFAPAGLTDRTGKVYFFSGATGALLGSISPSANEYQLGATMISIVDRNGDGYRDLVAQVSRHLTVPGVVGTRIRPAGLQLFSGKDRAFITEWSVNPEFTSSQGRGVNVLSEVGDFDGDTKGDFVSADDQKTYLHVSRSTRPIEIPGRIYSSSLPCDVDGSGKRLVALSSDHLDLIDSAGQIVHSLKTSPVQPTFNLYAQVICVKGSGHDFLLVNDAIAQKIHRFEYK